MPGYPTNARCGLIGAIAIGFGAGGALLAAVERQIPGVGVVGTFFLGILIHLDLDGETV